MVRSLVALVPVPVDLVQVLVDLVQAHSPQGGLQLVVSRQVVVGVRWKQVWYSPVVRGLGVGLVVSGQR